MRILIPQPLRSYTGAPEVPGRGATIAEVLADLDARYPGIRFRMIDEQDRVRPHIRFFVDGVMSLNLKDAVKEELMIVAALSGG